MDHPTDADHRNAEALFAQGQHTAAENLIRRLLPVYNFTGNHHLRGWAYARQAAIHLARGHHDLALRTHLDALRLLDPDRDPELFDGAVHDLDRLLALGGENITRFRRLVRENRRRRFTPHSRPWALHRWLEGTALLAGGRRHRAASTLSGARQKLLARGDGPTAILVTLAQVCACRALGQCRTAHLAARDTLDALEHLAVAPELVAAFAAYVEVLTDGGPVAEAAEQVRAAFDAARLGANR